MKYLLITVMVLLGSAGSMLLKMGMSHAPASASHLQSMLDFRVLAGITSFGCAALLYMGLLRWMPLNIVQSFSAAQFIATILLAWIALGEPIAPGQWIGIGAIASGIALVGYFAK